MAEVLVWMKAFIPGDAEGTRDGTAQVVRPEDHRLAPWPQLRGDRLLLDRQPGIQQ